MYNKGYSSIDLINYIKQLDIVNINNKYIIIAYFNKIKKYSRCEKYLILLLLNYLMIRSSSEIENIINI